MGLFSTPKQQQPKAPPPTLRLSDRELAVKGEAEKLRKRQGIEDQILSLGRIGSVGGGNGDRAPRSVSLLGRAA